MNPFSFRISLRIFHPTRKFSDISALVDIAPTGEKGSKARGQTYWHTYLFDGSAEDEFETVIVELAEMLKIKKAAFIQLRDEDARCEMVIATFGEKNHGFVIEAFAQYVFSQLGIDLGFDIYPGSPDLAQ